MEIEKKELRRKVYICERKSAKNTEQLIRELRPKRISIQLDENSLYADYDPFETNKCICGGK